MALPRVYHNIDVSDVNSANKVVVDSRCHDKEKSKNINQIINNIFTSSSFVYKKTARISTKNGSMVATIVGKSGNYLVTLDHGNININDIIDIVI